MNSAPDALVEALVPRIREMAVRGARRAGLSPDECEDAAQDVLLAFWRHDYDKVDVTRSVAGFVWQRVRWSVADIARGRSRHYRRHAFVEEALHERAPTADELIEEREREDLRRAVVAEMRDLHEREIAAVIAGLERGGLNDLARMHGVAASQTTRWRESGLAKLRDALDPRERGTSRMETRRRVDEVAKRIHRAGHRIDLATISRATGLGRAAITRALVDLGYQPEGERRTRHWLPPSTEVSS